MLNGNMPRVSAEKFRAVIVADKTSGLDAVENAQKAIHEAVEIKYFFEGSSTLLIGNTSVTAKAGDVVVINPFELHATIDNGTQKGRYHLVTVPLDYFTDMGIYSLDLKNVFLTKGVKVNNLFSQNKELAALILGAVREHNEKKPMFEFEICAYLMRFFVYILRNGIGAEGRVYNGEKLHIYSLVEPALRYIRDNYSGDVSVEALAYECHVSKQYFCRVFKIFAGKSAMKYLREYRMQIADTLLVNTGRSISQIAHSCGFADENYFCRCYRECYGVPPGTRRKQNEI